MRFVTMGGLMVAFVLSLAAPAQLVLTAVQLGLLCAAAVYGYHHFGDQALAFYNQLRGHDDEHGTTATEPAGARDAQRVEPEVDGTDTGAPTKG